MDTLEEKAWIAQAQAGDHAALTRLIRRHEGALMRFAQRMCGDPDKAADTVQDAMVNVVRALGTFRGDSAFSSWLFMVVRRACLHRVRKKKHEPRALDSVDAHGDHGMAQLASAQRNPAQVAGDKELGAALEQALLALEPRNREVMLLRDVEGLSAEEVATVLGIAVPAVKSRLHRARVSVREQLSPLLMDEPGVAPGKGCQDVVRLFSRHLEGEIDGSICRTMQTHLDGCTRCQAQCDSLKRTLKLCAAIPAQVPPHQQLEVRTALQQTLQGLGTSKKRAH